jgi:hypothetical protein
MSLLVQDLNILCRHALRRSPWLIAACLATPAFATLGGTAGVHDAKSAHVLPARSAGDAGGYTVTSTQLPSGTVVREFSRPDGRVFAIAWKGPHMPDMQSWLGTYYADYQSAVVVVRAERRPMEVWRPTLVAHSGGHMHAFHGRAWDPTLMPAGVDVNDIR